MSVKDLEIVAPRTENSDDLPSEFGDSEKDSQNKLKPRILDLNHPLMIKFQKTLKERLQNQLIETENQIFYLKQTISAQDSHNKDVAKASYDLQKTVKQKELRFASVEDQYKSRLDSTSDVEKKSLVVKEKYQSVCEQFDEKKNEDEFSQKTLEQIAFEVVQLSALREESHKDVKVMQMSSEKATKERQHLEVHKLRQDLLLSRLENDKFNFEDKIKLFKTQWQIKKEEAVELKKDLIAASAEMETINREKQQIDQQWRHAIISLGYQDKMLNEIKDVVRSKEDSVILLKTEVSSTKKNVRKELERNEDLTSRMRMRESNIARLKNEFKEFTRQGTDLEANVSMLERTVEITAQETSNLEKNKADLLKQFEDKIRNYQKLHAHIRSLEKKHLDALHNKVTTTRMSKYIARLIKGKRNNISIQEGKCSKREVEKENVYLKIPQLQTELANSQKHLGDLEHEKTEMANRLQECEASVRDFQRKIHSKLDEVQVVDRELKEIISRTGGKELGAIEREIANLKREIEIVEVGKKALEEEYLKIQRHLLAVSKECTVKSEESEKFNKQIAILEGRKIQLDADVINAEKDIKNVKNRISVVRKEIAGVSRILTERKEVEENLLKSTANLKKNYFATVKDAEISYYEKQNKLRKLQLKKKRYLPEILAAQKSLVFWQGKVHLADETRKILKSEKHLKAFSDLQFEIRRLQLKQDKIKKEQKILVENLNKGANKHVDLIVEADKQVIAGKRKKSSDFCKQKIRHLQRSIAENKKVLKENAKKIEDGKSDDQSMNEEILNESQITSEMMSEIKSIESDIVSKWKEKQQSVIKLSLTQKKLKYLQEIQSGVYVRAIRNPEQRHGEIEKLNSGLYIIRVIAQEAKIEYPHLETLLERVVNYVTVSKDL